MSIRFSASESFKKYNGTNDSGRISRPLALLLSIFPRRRLIKLASKSPVIVNAPNNTPVNGCIPNKIATTVLKKTAENKPLQVLLLPNKR